MKCVNINHPDWKALVEAVGLESAKDAYILNNQDIPSVKKAKRLLTALSGVSIAEEDKDADRYVMPTLTANEEVLVENNLSTPLSNKINSFLSSIGVRLSATNSLDSKGTLANPVAKASMVQKTILFAQGRFDVSMLGEEAAHFYVEMMDENSPLFKEMYDKITLYEVYDEVVIDYYAHYREMYPDDFEARLRKEAMGRLIGSHIIGQQKFSTGAKQGFAIRWWDKVVNFIKGVFGGQDVNKFTNMVTSDPYYESAMALLDGNLSELDLDKNIEGEYFHLDTTAKEIVNKILDRDSKLELNEATHVYKYLGKVIKESVTELVNRINPYRGTVDEDYKTITQESGTLIHAYIRNSIDRAVEGLTGNVTTRAISDDPIYKAIDTYFSEFVKNPAFTGGTFLTEKKIVDEKASRAGSVDLAIVMPDGTTHLFDWKSTNFKTLKGVVMDERVSATKERNYNIQLKEYKRILKEQYGITKFGQIRVIPIQTVFASQRVNNKLVKTLKEVKLGTEDEYLKPIISDEERTGVDALDNLINALIKRKRDTENNLNNVRGTGLEAKRKRDAIRGKLVQIAKAITEIHLNHKIDQFLDFMDDEITRLSRAGVGSTDGTLDAYTDLEFERTVNNIQYFQTILRDNLSALDSVIEPETNERLEQLATRLTKADSRIKQELLRRLDIIGDSQGVKGITKPQTQTGFWSRNLRYASQQTNGIMATLWKLVDKQKGKLVRDHAKLNAEIAAKNDALQAWGAKNGYGGVAVFNLLIDKKSGKNKLINKYNPEFVARIKKAYEDPTSTENSTFLDNNIVFDKAKYERVLMENEAMWQEQYPEDPEIVARKVAWFENAYNVEKTSEAYGDSNFFTTWKDKAENHSNEYKFIYKTGNEPLKEFYEMFTQYTKEWRDVYGLDRDGHFIWNVKKDFTEKLLSNGLGAFNTPSMMTQLENAEWDRAQQVETDETGQQLLDMPKYFVTPITKVVKQADGSYKTEPDPANTSQDLAKVLSLAGAMAMNHKYMGEIEESAKLLKLGIQPHNSSEIVTDFRGRPVKDLITGGLQTRATSADTIESFNDFMNYYIYGVKNKSKEITVDILGKKVNLLKSYNNLSKYFVGKTLAFNPMSIAANVIGGSINARILGVSSKYFSNKQYSRAVYNLLPSRDTKAYALMGYFDIMTGSKFSEKANDLSVQFLTRNLTYDKLFIGHEKTDSWMRNATLLAMLQNHTIKDGRVVKKTGTEQSLYDLAEIKDGNLVIEGLTDELYQVFRNKALAVGEKILGNSTRENIRGTNLTVLGRTMMMFRGWIPRMADVRFGELRKDYDLDEYEYGRYRSFFKTIFEDHLGKTAQNITHALLDFGILGWKPYSANNLASNAALNARFEELWYKAKEEDENLDISLEEFKQLYMDNLRTSLMEFQIMTTLLIAFLALKGAAGDEKKSSQLKLTLAILDRARSEMGFFTGGGVSDILKNFFPMMSFVQQVKGLGSSIVTDIFGGEQPESYKNSLERTRSFFPILYAFDRLETMATKGN